MVAVISGISSGVFCGVSGNPALSSTSVLRPGTAPRFLLRLRRARIMSRIPKSISAAEIGGRPTEATSGLGETVENLTPLMTFFSSTASFVKFWETRNVPPKSTTAIIRFGEALESTNCNAAFRARIWSLLFMVELSKNRTIYCGWLRIGEFASFSKEKLVISCSFLSSQTLKSFAVRSRI